jgi:energy-coupling factor transporter ATP-binding protein EcfA2
VQDSWAFLTDSGIVSGGLEDCWKNRGASGHSLFPYSYRLEEQLRSVPNIRDSQKQPIIKTSGPAHPSPDKPTAPVPAENVAVATDMVYHYQGTGAFTLGPINFSIPKGKVTAILGPNGSGKTTLLKCLANLLPGREGQIAWAGLNLRPSDPIWAWTPHALYCFQDPDDQLFMETIEGELRCTARYAAKNELPDSSVEPMATSLGIKPYLILSPLDAPLSVRRLTLIGAALLATPKLLLLDEPTLSLDAEQVELLTSELKRYTDAGGTVVAISHDYDFVAEIADNVLLMKDGEIVNQVERNTAEFPCAETLQPSIIRRALRAGIHPPPWGLKELKKNLQALSVQH